MSAEQQRPSREQLKARLALMKRGIVILAAGSFGAISLLAAGRATAGNAQKATPVQQAPAQNQGSGEYEGDDGYFSYVPPQTPSGGTLGGGSAAGPPVAGTHAS